MELLDHVARPAIFSGAIQISTLYGLALLLFVVVRVQIGELCFTQVLEDDVLAQIILVPQVFKLGLFGVSLDDGVTLVEHRLVFLRGLHQGDNGSLATDVGYFSLEPILLLVDVLFLTPADLCFPEVTICWRLG